MRIACRILLPFSLFSSGLDAQTTLPANEFYRWDRSTEFTDRAVGSASGFVSQAFSHGHSAGLGGLTATSFVIQDQNPSTREIFDVGITGITAAGRPDYPRMTAYATNLAMPMTMQTLPLAMRFTVTSLSSRPILVPPTLGQWHHVWVFRNTAAWPNDGISLHFSQAAPWKSTLLCSGRGHREIPRSEGGGAIRQGLAWAMASTQTTPQALNRAWGLRSSWTGMALNGGALTKAYGGYYGPADTIGCNTVDPNVGYAALDPDFNDIAQATPSRHDDYTWILNAGTRNAGRPAFLYIANTVLGNGGAPTPCGSLHLDIGDPLFRAIGAIAMPTLSATGESRLDLNLGPASSRLRPILANFESVSAQALVFTDAGCSLSNLFTFRPRLLPNGFTSNTVTSGMPIQLRPTRGIHRTILVRNDGAGAVRVTQRRGTTRLGQVQIGERTAVRISVNPASTQVEIGTAQTGGVNLIWAWNR